MDQNGRMLEIGVRKKVDVDDWDVMSVSSTETIEVANCSQRLRGFFLRIFLSLIVIGACAGALVWSFVNGEAGINVVHERNASVNFSILVDEYSVKEGVYTVIYRTPDSSMGGLQYIKEVADLQTPLVYPSFWYQDNTNQRLVHQVSEDTTIYAFPKFSFWVRYGGSGNITEQTHHHKEVFIYDGDPDNVILEGSLQTAFLLTAYADAANGALLGWDTYFTSVTSTDLYQTSYWYDSMLPAAPNTTWFDPPSLCEPGDATLNRVRES
ncbi:unnamed protein product [Haemonchus placei]|uniref:DUF2341 domain-containing protein n=1 Tax=Haemonchus placei TaxID=6290 RepID=A0A0N4WZJ7_HAEPC|nr:unnamed protein product [Haemonchus placei]